jgi:mercuric ion binding protein
MKKLFLLTFLSLSLIGTLANAATIKAKVNGLVCSFCATGIEKTFKKQPAVESVKVDLSTKLVTIETKKDQDIDNATITKLVGDAGYTIVNIERQK